MSDVDLRVDWCSYEAAKYAVTHWHYSRSLPTPPHNRVGVWENNQFIGCVIFGRGSNNNGHKPYKLDMTEFCELTRIALSRHETPVSRIVKLAIAFLKQKSPGIRLIVSYADPNVGHYGGIYQAGNWVYTGKTSDDFEAIDKSGRKWHSRQVSRTGVKRQYGTLRSVPKLDDCEIVKLSGKHRYLYPLDRAMRKQIAPLAKPYPKRESCGPSVEGDTSGDQPEGAGSIPAARSEVQT